MLKVGKKINVSEHSIEAYCNSCTYCGCGCGNCNCGGTSLTAADTAGSTQRGLGSLTGNGSYASLG